MTACKQLSILPDIEQKIIHGDCLEEMRKMADNSISAIVTDPPYGLNFMGKHWDDAPPSIDIWQEALRICKPGAHLLAFGGSRTHHHLMMAIERAGWEIRDVIMWIYGSEFPKSHNHFGIPGYGTALKPAYEPIIMAMKPCDGTFKQNAEKWGQAGINIDGCRVGLGDDKAIAATKELIPFSKGFKFTPTDITKGRWPANVIFDEEAGALLDQMSGVSKSPKSTIQGQSSKQGQIYGKDQRDKCKVEYFGDSGGASRFFYCAKASPSERNAGCEGLPDFFGSIHLDGGPWKENKTSSSGQQERLPRKNNHPTVKPIKLMEYLIKLVMPPKDGILLDPFMGSGTTLVAAKNLGINAIGIEKEAEYCEIANARLS